MKLTEFVLAGCPYCAVARDVLDELRRERPELEGIEIELVDESLEPERADRYDYYRVPSFFIGERKLYEASPLWPRAEVKRRLGAMFDALLAEK